MAARSCEALRVIKPFWDAEVPLAFNNAAGCYRVLVEPAWDLAYARQSGPDAPLEKTVNTEQREHSVINSVL